VDILPQLTPDQKRTIQLHIDQEMGKRAGNASLIYVLFILSLFYFSDIARQALPLAYLPSSIVVAAAILRQVLANRLATNNTQDLTQCRMTYLAATLSMVIGWSGLALIFVIKDPTSSISTIFIIASAAMTAGGMGTMTQYKKYWRIFQGLLWAPIVTAMVLATPEANNETVILTIFAVIFALFSTRIGDQVSTEYWQAQVTQMKLFSQTSELTEAKLKIEQQTNVVAKHRDYLEDMVEAQTSELLTAIQEVKEANIAKDAFLANMSHELRTPMHAIISFASIGIKKIKANEPEQLEDYFEKIQNSGNRLMRLLNDLLDLAKLESGSVSMAFCKGSLVEVILSRISELEAIHRNKKVSLTIHPKNLDTYAEFDTSQIGQVVENLLSNALRYTEEQGIVEVSISNEGDEGFSLEHPFLQVSIMDHGIGIPPGEELTVFDRFIQSSKTATGAGGTGLGLSICHEIIEAHRGLIWAENSPEGGAIFQFQIPVSQSTASFKETTADSE